MEVVGTERQTGASGGGFCDCRASSFVAPAFAVTGAEQGAGSYPWPGWCPIFEAPGLFLASGPWKQVWSRLEGHAWNLFKSCAHLFRS